MYERRLVSFLSLDLLLQSLANLTKMDQSFAFLGCMMQRKKMSSVVALMKSHFTSIQKSECAKRQEWTGHTVRSGRERRPARKRSLAFLFQGAAETSCQSSS